jgi:hypothetical protein
LTLWVKSCIALVWVPASGGAWNMCEWRRLRVKSSGPQNPSRKYLKPFAISLSTRDASSYVRWE